MKDCSESDSMIEIKPLTQIQMCDHLFGFISSNFFIQLPKIHLHFHNKNL